MKIMAGKGELDAATFTDKGKGKLFLQHQIVAIERTPSG